MSNLTSNLQPLMDNKGITSADLAGAFINIPGNYYQLKKLTDKHILC